MTTAPPPPPPPLLSAIATSTTSSPSRSHTHPSGVYGTFAHNGDDLEADKHRADTGASKPAQHVRRRRHDNSGDDLDDADADELEPRECGCEQGDCCFVMALLCAPVRLQTYKVLLFHVANAALALLAAAWMVLAVGGARLSAVATAAAAAGGDDTRVQRVDFERRSLRFLLRADAALLNFMSPLHERVQARGDGDDALASSSSSSSSSCASRVESGGGGDDDDNEGSRGDCDRRLLVDAAPRIYFGGAKLVCCALPGAVAAAVFVGALQRVAAVALCVLQEDGSGDACDAALLGDLLPASSGLRRHFLATAAQDRDVLVLLAVLAVYGAALVLRVAAHVARHASLYFCGDHLRYELSLGGSSGGSSSTRPLLDDATLHQWSETGARRIRAKLAKAFAETTDAIGPADELYKLLYELVGVVVHAKLTRQEVVSVLKDAELSAFPEACETFLDLVWVVGNEVEASEKGREHHSSPEWQQLCRFVKAIADEEVVPLFSLKASLEYELLHAAGLVSEVQLMRKKILRINTKSLYTQRKYNLLREESEGFAKVLSLLHTGVTPAQLEASQTDLMALIGYFDLDASRVLDLALDAYEMQPQNACFVELLGSFKRASIPHVLGFKFQFYKRDAADGFVTPRSLYRLAATLLANGLLDLDALLPHLAPSKDEIVAQYSARIQQLEAAARAFGKVNLASKADEAAEKPSEADDSDEHNQVFGLIVGLLEIGAEKQAFEMIKWFQGRGVNPLAYAPLTAQFCASVHALIQDLYAPLSLKTMQLVASATKKLPEGDNGADDALGFLKPLTTPDELVSVVFPILEMLGPQLHRDQLLFTKLLRIIGHLLEGEAAKTADGGRLLAKVQDVIVKSFLPSITHQGSNPSAVFQLWDLIKLYPFEQRYRMYQQWQAAYARSPEMKLVEAQVVQATRKVMRRLTADRAKPSARSLTHFAHANPLVVFRTMLRQIQSYDNLIQPVVESFKFVTPLGMDVLSFVLVSELARSRQSMKADGTNVSLWLASLASFSGSFYRKYPNVELTGLLQYLIQRLQNWESVDLVVLSELLSKMGSCISFEDISLSQLEAQAGGPHLWYEPADPKLMNRRAIPRLRDALVKRDLALPLCLLICQMRSRIEFHENSPRTHLKLLGRVYDTCQMTLSQLLQFLNGVVDPLVYTKMLPSVTALVREFHILPELAMTLCRPAIRFDDPVLRKAPRSVHSTTAAVAPPSSSSSESGASWFMNAPALLADVGEAILGAPGVDKDPFVGVTKDLYVTFWSLILYDIHVPFPQYEAEILRLRNAAAAGGANASLSGTERKKLKEKTAQMIDKLTNEQKDQVAHRKRVFERLEEKKRSFFAREAAEHRTAVAELLQRCVIPRALLSPEDALFCAKFMERLHAINTPEFSALQYYNMVNLKLPSLVLCVTEREAGNLGIFVKESVTLLHRWYQSGATYEEDALHGKSGFSLDLHDPKKKLGHRQYKLLYAKWHKGMARVFGATLAGGAYMPIRTTLILLTKVIDVFPASKSAAEGLLEVADALTKEDREDIKIMAKRYCALLTKRKATLIEDKLLFTPAPAPADKKAAAKDDDAAKEPAVADDDDAASEKAASPPQTQPPTASGDRKGGRVLRQDLESGEISSPPPPSTRRSSERATDGAKDARSRLKRRDSDRAGDEKRGRRDASPGKPPLAAAPGNRSSSSSSSAPPPPEPPAAASGHKRDRSRERRSRSAETRRNGRERDANGARASDAPAKESGGDAKRQRVEQSEAALRRQLTEKKDQQEARREAAGAASTNSSSNSNSNKGGGDAGERSERQQPAAAAARKIVSLVAARKREVPPGEDDDGRQGGSGLADSGELSDDKRRREAGRGGGGAEREREKHRGSGDDKKKARHARKSHDGSGGGGGASGAGGGQQSQPPQQRGEQQSGRSGGNASGNGSGGPDRRGGGGQGRGNEERSNGGRRRDERRGRR